MRWQHILNVTTNLAILLVLGFVSCTMWSTRQARAARADVVSPTASPPPDRAGVEELGTELGKKGPFPSVLVAMSPTCSVCEQDLPAFRRLSRAGRQGGRFGVEFAVPLKGPTPTDLVDGVAVDDSQVHRVRFPKYGIHSVPLIAVLDSRGRVSQLWTGLIGGRQESEILRAVSEAH